MHRATVGQVKRLLDVDRPWGKVLARDNPAVSYKPKLAKQSVMSRRERSSIYWEQGNTSLVNMSENTAGAIKNSA